MSTTQSWLENEHPSSDDALRAVVARLFRDEGYGFLRASDGREIFFHRNAVADDDFDGLAEGVEVRFSESTGRLGPKASTVEIIDPPLFLESSDLDVEPNE